MANYVGDDAANSVSYWSVVEMNRIDLRGGDDIGYGGQLSDTILGGDGNDYLFGDSGNDYIYSGLGVDTLYGSDGSDLLLVQDGGVARGGPGDDVIEASGSATTRLAGEAGDDLFYAGFGADSIDGRAGEDEVSYESGSTGATVDLQSGRGSGEAAGDTYVAIENVTGSQLGDSLIGNGAYNVLLGLGGNDVIRGGAGGDRLDGGDGSDVLDYRSSDAGVRVDLATGATFGGDAQGDQFVAFERIWGSNYGDALSGDGAGNVLRGFGGNDALAGRAGRDMLQGLDGNDRLMGGLGADRLEGGAGADTFQFRTTAESRPPVAGRDIIADFSSAEHDRIDLSGIDANTEAGGNQAFHFLGSGFFDGRAGALRYGVDADGATVIGDVNGDRRIDFAIDVADVTVLHAGDFVL